MLPPVAEIYVVWHPADEAGASIARDFIRHFHGTIRTGLLDGAVEVYVRFEGFAGPEDAPLDIPPPMSPRPDGLHPAEFVIVVPVLGRGMASAVQRAAGPWYEYLTRILGAQARNPERVRVLPLSLGKVATEGTTLGRLTNSIYRIGARTAMPTESDSELRCRDLGQAIARLTGGSPDDRLKVFISYTSHTGDSERADVADLIGQVKTIIRQTKLRYYIDTEDLQPGDNWSTELQQHTRSSAFLALRTDLYASSKWCQAEIREAKCAGVPVVILDALGRTEARGSFLMDHVPRVPVRDVDGAWSTEDIRRGLNLLVNECLKRALWLRQRQLVERILPDLEVDWWAAQAPEPTTLTSFLIAMRDSGDWKADKPIRIMHPDPPLGAAEQEVMDEIASIAGIAPLDIVTPRSLAARGGLTRNSDDLLPADALAGSTVGLSVSASADLGRLGLLEDHFMVALSELTRAILSAGGNIVYGGRPRPDGYTGFVASLAEQSRFPERPFTVCLAWQEHRELSLAELHATAAELDDFGTLVCLDPDGVPVDPAGSRGQGAALVTDERIRGRSLTGLRTHMCRRQTGRVFVGGQRTGFHGVTAGLIEEALLALSAGQPVFLAAGFGGVTADIAHALKVDDDLPLPRAPSAGAEDPRLRDGLARLAEVAQRPGWTGLHNGLRPDENAELLRSCRAADIASLVCLGLGRLNRLSRQAEHA